MRDCIQRPSGLTQLRPLLHHWSHGRCPWCWRILLLSRRVSARGSGHPRTSAVSQALIVLNNVERGQIFNYSPKKKVALLFLKRMMDGRMLAPLLPLLLSDACVSEEATPISSLSLSPPVLSVCAPLPLSSSPPPSLVVIGWAHQRWRNGDGGWLWKQKPPRVAAQQGHQFSWLNFLI